MVHLTLWIQKFWKKLSAGVLKSTIAIPIQRNNCIETFWLRKEIPVNSAKMQDLVQPLGRIFTFEASQVAKALQWADILAQGG